MTPAEAVLDRIRQAGFSIRPSGRGTVIVFPTERLTPELAEAIKANRSEIRLGHVGTSSSLRPDAEARIRAWLAHIRETDPTLIEDVLMRCAQDPDCLAYFMTRAGEVPPERLAGQETR